MPLRGQSAAESTESGVNVGQRALPSPVGPGATSASVLSPGDAVRITVWRKPELSGEFQVSADGTIADPFYMDVQVVGVPLTSVGSRVRAHLERYETEPRVLIEPLFRVSVAGEVRQPKLYTFGPETTIAQAVMHAGGPTERGNLNRVRLLREGAKFDVDLSTPQNGLGASPIQSGDVLVVTRRTSVVRDVIAPISSITSAVVSIMYVTGRYFFNK